MLKLEAFEEKKTFATKELNIFTGINFREPYKIKYFTVPIFRKFAKKFRKLEPCENFLL